MALLTRRSLLGGIGAVLAAPYIVRAASLMPVKAWADDEIILLNGSRLFFDNLAPENRLYIVTPPGKPDFMICHPAMKKIFDDAVRHLV